MITTYLKSWHRSTPAAPDRTRRRLGARLSTGLALSALIGLASAVPAEAATYRDNEVRIDYVSPRYAVDSTSYTITDYRITDGQDNDGRIRTGQYRAFNGSGGSFWYSIGRHASGDVASWWKGRFAANQTTFNHDPGELNFAFIGTLRIAIHGNGLGDASRNFEISDLGLAQGHAGSSNNWWVGGRGCTHAVDQSYPLITCTAYEVGNPGNYVTVDLKRGGNGVNQIQVTSISNPPTTPDGQNAVRNTSGMAKLCSDWYSQGRCMFTGGSAPNLGWSLVGNDQLSSIEVPSGKTLLLYYDWDYRGRCQAFTSSVTFLNGYSIGNDTVSSYKLLPGTATCS